MARKEWFQIPDDINEFKHIIIQRSKGIMETIFVIEGTKAGHKWYYSEETDDYYSGFMDNIAGATIFNRGLYNLCLDNIKANARIQGIEEFHKRFVYIYE